MISPTLACLSGPRHLAQEGGFTQLLPLGSAGTAGRRRKVSGSTQALSHLFSLHLLPPHQPAHPASDTVPHEGTFQGRTMADAQAEKQNRKEKAPKSQMQFSQGFALVLFWHELLRGKLLLPFPLQAGPVPASGLRHSPGSRCLAGGD